MRKTFEVFFNDGNRKLFESKDYDTLLFFLIENKLYQKVIDIKERV